MKDIKEKPESKGQGMSRRGFLKASLAGAAAVPLAGLTTDLLAGEGKRTHHKGPTQGLMIDAFCHIMPAKYTEAFAKRSKVRPDVMYTGRFGMASMSTMADVDARLRMMDKYPGYVQILNITGSNPEDLLSPKDAAEVCKIANDSMAELVYKYPDRFVAATAVLPLNDMDEAMKELDRAIKDLRLKGVQVSSTIMDKPLDSPEFRPLFEKMNAYNLPIQIHPKTPSKGPRALNMAGNDQVGMWAEFAYQWPYETTIAMGRLVFSGMMEKYPNLKILTHHLGGVVPYHAERVSHFFATSSTRYAGGAANPSFPKPVLDYYKMIYGDTACYGRVATLMDGFDFFGADHVLFATDYPYDAASGDIFIRETINSVEEMDIPDETRKKIFEENARRLFRLPV